MNEQNIHDQLAQLEPDRDLIRMLELLDKKTIISILGDLSTETLVTGEQFRDCVHLPEYDDIYEQPNSHIRSCARGEGMLEVRDSLVKKIRDAHSKHQEE